jgi:hypothetical protein
MITATASRSGVTNSGAMEMSTAPLARIETLSLEVTGVVSTRKAFIRAVKAAALERPDH